MAAADHEGAVRDGFFPDLFFQVDLRLIISAEIRKRSLFAAESIQAGCKHPVLCLAHGQHLFIGEVQKALQSQLFIDGICPVDGASVGALDTVNAVCQVLFQGVPAQDAEIVETDIGGQLEFQNGAGFLQVFDELFSSAGFQVGGIEAVADPHGRHGLARGQGIFYTAQALRHIVFEGVVLTGMDPDDKARMCSGYGDKLFDQRLQVADIVDLFADDIGSGHVGVAGDSPKSPDLILDHPLGLHLIPDDGQRDPSERSQKAEHDTRIPDNGGHAFMDLPQKRRCLVGLYQPGVGDFHVADPALLTASGDPEKFVLQQGKTGIVRVGAVFFHTDQRIGDLPVRHGLIFVQINRVVSGHALGKNIAVEVDLFQIGKDCLPVFEDGQGCPDEWNVIGGVIGVRQDEIREIDEGVVVDPPGQIFPPQGRIREALSGHSPPPGQDFFLLRCAAQLQFAYVVEGITDLVVDAQGDQDVGIQIRVHVGVEVCAEFIVPWNICLDQCVPGTQVIIFGLAHQGLGDGRNGGLPLYGSVGINIGDFGVAQPQDIDSPVGVVDIAGNLSPYYFETVLVEADRETAEVCQVGDQIARRVVGGAQHIGKRTALHEEVDDDVFFFIKIKMTESTHMLCLLKRLRSGFFCLK